MLTARPWTERQKEGLELIEVDLVLLVERFQWIVLVDEIDRSLIETASPVADGQVFLLQKI